MTDFQDVFMSLFWPPLALGLGVYAAVMTLGAFLYLATRSVSYYNRRNRSTAFGQDFSDA